MIPEEYDLSSYDFALPLAQIAQVPPALRCASRLLVLDKKSGEMRDDHFENIAQALPDKALVVVNNTKVVRARLHGRRESGAKVEFLLLTPLPLIKPEFTSANERLAEVTGLLKPSKRTRVGERLYIGEEISIQVVEIGAYGMARAILRWQGDLGRQLEAHGHWPLPPYIKREDKDEDGWRYQTVYAKDLATGSVAAPTAGLHFTADILRALERRGCARAEITLHVGYGTFSPMRVEDIREHTPHAEYVSISEQSAVMVREAKAQGRPVVAVGTTTVRALEGVAQKCGEMRDYEGYIDAFIRPGHTFTMVDSLATNFHLPQSSLLLLVAAMAGRENILRAYAHARDAGYRFFSYGDAMFIR